jgi:flagellar protein FlaG|tara:strand:+ start:486 stop:845 length:360 start_codon:yes stop_codon:yes gene_type:complete
MSLDISSFAGRLNSPARVAGQAQRPGKENTQSGLKANPVKNLDAKEGKPDSIETGVLDRVGFSANYKVGYKIDPETHEVVIRVVDSESGEVIKQIPGEDFVKLAQRIAEFNQKSLDQTA